MLVGTVLVLGSVKPETGVPRRFRAPRNSVQHTSHLAPGAPRGAVPAPGIHALQLSDPACLLSPLPGRVAWSLRGCREMQLTLVGIRMMSGSSSSGVANKITKDLNLQT